MTCPRCKGENPDGFRFCGTCGASLLAEAALRREERKIVTCLFCDLVGFTSHAERMDPEDVRALLAPYHVHVRSELERFGGTVEKFIGDAVMGLFGAPVSHEDDPERAVRAALAIRDWARRQGEDLRVRIAVNTGEALITMLARPSEGESMAAGDVVNTAARLQGFAPTNGVLVGEATYRATKHAIDYQRRDPVEAKGKAEPINVWEARQPRARVGVDVVLDVHASLVGRRRELALLSSTLERAREERSPELVTLVGVPGIGKSRLVFELFRTIEAIPELIAWRQGRSLPYGEGVAFWALSEIIKAQAGILESDPAEEVEAKLQRAVADVTPDTSEAQWLERHLRPLAGLAEQGPATPDESLAAWRRFLEALAEDRPLVLVFEDLHWADDALLDFVDHLVGRASSVPLLILATARPELLSRRPAWGGGKPNALTISLSPLSDEDTARLVSTLLERPLLEAQTQAELLARAGGNPLYAEQYARILLEGCDVRELPETVHGIIAARIDSLDDEEKSLLQDAAVVGKVFWPGALDALGDVVRRQTEDLLHSLERKEFVQRVSRSSVADESEYRFRHVLIRDVAYGTIPRAARSEKHRRAAAWIESLGRPQDHADMLAHHHVRALELAEAAGLNAAVLADSARRALRTAGDRAAALSAPEAAERFYDAALRLWPEDDPERAQVLFRRATAGATWTESDVGLLAEARDALLAAGDTTRAAEAEMLLAASIRMQGRRDLADEHAERAVELLGDASPSRSSAFVLVRRAAWEMLAGRLERGLAIGSAALEMTQKLGWDEGRSEVLSTIGVARVFGGDRSGLEDLRKSIEAAAAAGALGAQSRAYNNLSVAYQVLGEMEAAFEARFEASRIADRMGVASQVRWFQPILADFQYRRGDWDDALRLADAFIAEVDEGSPHLLLFQAAVVRAEIWMARGDMAVAIQDAERALQAGRASGEPQGIYFVLAACANVFSKASQIDRAAALLRELLDALRSGVSIQVAVITLPLAAAAAHRLGLAEELRDAISAHAQTPWTEAVRAYTSNDFTKAADILARIGSKPQEAEARLRAAEVLLHEGRRDQAYAQLEQALAFWRNVGATTYIKEGEALMGAAKEGPSGSSA